MSSRLRSTKQDNSRLDIAITSSQASVLSKHKPDISQTSLVGQSEAHGHRQNKAFSITFYDQGCAHLAQQTTYAHPLNTNCPFHAAIMRIDLHLPSSEPYFTQEALARMPPVGLTHCCRVGTSLSCGCTCGQSSRIDIQNFVKDVEGIIRNPCASTQMQDLTRLC
jgi:hypothetical protein